jgi:Ca-activated chloride channel family protein
MTLDANIRLDHELLAVEDDNRVHCMLEIKAPPAAEGESRPPLHLGLVIDRSGSMAGEKLHTASACAAFLARRLGQADQLSVVTFDDEVRLEWPLQPVAGQQEQLAQTLRQILAGGSTNLSGGWLKGVEQLAAVAGGQGPKKLLLLTDGQANQGITDQSTLVELARSAADKQGVGTTTIGFGEGFDEVLLTLIADAGGGNAYYAATTDEVPGIFAQEFEGLVSLAAQNLSIEIRPTEHVQMLGVLNDYRCLSVSGGVQVQMGDIYADERRRLVFELLIPRLEALGPATVADVVARYVGVAGSVQAHELHVPITVNLVSADEAAAHAPNAEVVEEVVVLKSARAQQEAREHAERGEYDLARKLLSEAARELCDLAPGSARAQELLEQATEIEGNLGMMYPESFDVGTAKTMLYQSRQRQRGRKQKGRQEPWRLGRSRSGAVLTGR